MYTLPTPVPVPRRPTRSAEPCAGGNGYGCVPYSGQFCGGDVTAKLLNQSPYRRSQAELRCRGATPRRLCVEAHTQRGAARVSGSVLGGPCRYIDPAELASGGHAAAAGFYAGLVGKCISASDRHCIHMYIHTHKSPATPLLSSHPSPGSTATPCLPLHLFPPKHPLA